MKDLHNYDLHKGQITLANICSCTTTNWSVIIVAAITVIATIIMSTSTSLHHESLNFKRAFTSCSATYNLSGVNPITSPVIQINLCQPSNVFIDPNLLELQLRNPKPDETLSPYMSESNKLLLCWIPKNSCTKFKQLLARLNGISEWNNTITAHSSKFDIRANKQPRSKLGQIIRDESWKRVAILRDPMERFVSGYLDKAVGQCWFKDSRKDRGCGCFNATLGDFSEFLESDVWIDNGHFALQWRFCGFDTYPWIWNEIIFYNERSVEDATLKSLSTHVDQNFLTSGWRGGRMFAAHLGHETSGTVTRAKFLEKLCRDNYSRKRLYTRLRSDYDFFKFPQSSICDDQES